MFHLSQDGERLSDCNSCRNSTPNYSSFRSNNSHTIYYNYKMSILWNCGGGKKLHNMYIFILTESFASMKYDSKECMNVVLHHKITFPQML